MSKNTEKITPIVSRADNQSGKKIVKSNTADEGRQSIAGAMILQMIRMAEEAQASNHQE